MSSFSGIISGIKNGVDDIRNQRIAECTYHGYFGGIAVKSFM